MRREFRDFRSLNFLVIFFALMLSASLTDLVFAQDKDRKKDFSLSRLKEQPITYIDGRNASAFEAILLPQIKKILVDTPEVIEAVADKKIVVKGESSPLADISSLSTENPESLPFLPGGKDINFQTAQAAERIMWNYASRLYEYPIQNMLFTYFSSVKDLPTVMVKGEIKKIYPARLPQPPAIRQFFREVFKVLEPSSLARYGWLTFRFFGDDEDFVQVYSPSIKKSRQVTGTNRTDPVLRGLLTLEDLDVPKPEYIQTTLKDKTILLVPFMNEASVSIESDKNCLKGATVIDDSSGLLSRKVTWRPREVYVVELTQKDPFSKVGRIDFFIDSESFIPFFKIVYSRSGEEEKFIVYNFSSFQGEGFFPYRINLMSQDLTKAESVTFTSTEFCKSFKEGQGLGDYDPKKMLEPLL